MQESLTASSADDLSPELERFLEAVDIRVRAFGICEIGQQFSLRCKALDSVVVHFVLRGEGFLDCSYGRFPIEAGTTIVVPRSLPKRLSGVGPVRHVRDADPTCTLEDGLLRFRASDGEASLVLGCAELSSSIQDELPLFNWAKRPIVEHSQNPLLREMFTTVFDEVRNPRLGTRAFVSALMKQILIVLLRSQPNNDSSILLMTDERFAGVVAGILDHPDGDHRVDSLASVAGMSRSRFSHHFTAAYGCSPTAFVKAVRLVSAARMLKGSKTPVKSIAAAVGYASRSQFSRAFQEKYGVDPSTFRQQSRHVPSTEVAQPTPRRSEALSQLELHTTAD